MLHKSDQFSDISALKGLVVTLVDKRGQQRWCRISYTRSDKCFCWLLLILCATKMSLHMYLFYQIKSGTGIQQKKRIKYNFEQECFTSGLISVNPFFFTIIIFIAEGSAVSSDIVAVVSFCRFSCKLTLTHSLLQPEATCPSFITHSGCSTALASPFNDIVHLWMQETLEDIDKNGDGHVDEDEYIGEFEDLKN